MGFEEFIEVFLYIIILYREEVHIADPDGPLS